jgi:hypothetical protein
LSLPMPMPMPCHWRVLNQPTIRARSRIKFVIHFMYIDCTYILVKKF